MIIIIIINYKCNFVLRLFQSLRDRTKLNNKVDYNMVYHRVRNDLQAREFYYISRIWDKRRANLYRGMFSFRLKKKKKKFY